MLESRGQPLDHSIDRTLSRHSAARPLRLGIVLCAVAIVAAAGPARPADAPAVPPSLALPEPAPPVAGVVPDVVVEAPEPRYVAPTRRDRIGRIWAPVLINDQGPFRLVLDTGANRSAVNASVAAALGIPLVNQEPLVLRGVTGTRTVPSIPIDSLVIGDLELRSKRLAIVIDALGGAEGVLGTEGLQDKRIFIDFLHDKISIFRSHSEHPPPGFVIIPIKLVGGLLLVADVKVGRVHAKAIIDTGGQATIANTAFRDAIVREVRQTETKPDEITGATLDVQKGERLATPPIEIGTLELRHVHITVGDLYIFQHWRMTSEPTILIGMDVLGLLDTLIIDYKRRELQARMRAPGA